MKFLGILCLVPLSLLLLSNVSVATEKHPLAHDQCITQFGIGDIISARRSSNEFLIAQIRQDSAEADSETIDNYYMPVFSVSSRAGKSNSQEFNKDELSAEKSRQASRDNYLGLHATQRLPGGGSLEISVNKDWDLNSARTSPEGDSQSQSTQHYYQVEARQPLLQGAGKSASAELSIANLSQQAAHLNQRIFLQDDLLKSINLYTELVSGQQNVLRAKRSLQASTDFLRATQAQVSQGVLAKSEVDQAQYAVAQSQLELAYAQQEQKNGADRLFIFSGLSVSEETPLKVLPLIAIDAHLLTREFPQTINEIELAKLNMNIARQNNVLAENANKAELNAVASYGKGWGRRSYSSDLSDVAGNGWRSQSYIGLEFKKVLNDYPARTLLKKSALDLEEKKLALNDMQSRAKLQQISARREFDSARRNLQLIEKKIAVSRKSFANERFKIEAGRSTAFLVYAAKISLDQAESEYIDSTSRYVLAAAGLYKAFDRMSEFVAKLDVQHCSAKE